MAKKQLYIFVTSASPNVYINSIRHCNPPDDIERDIVFISILVDKDKKAGAEASLNDLICKVKSQIDNLSKGKYCLSDETIKDIEIENHDKRRYTELLGLNLKSKIILHENLEKDLREIKENSVIFDISGLEKDYLIDVYTISHLLKNCSLCYFKLKIKNRTYDEKELIHNLHLHEDYEYENISESHVTIGTKVIRDNEELKQIDEIIDGWADSYAKIITNIFRAIIIISLVIFIILFLQNLKNWNEIEPWTFLLLAPIIWLFNLIFQFIFGKNVKDALNFQNIHYWLKSNKLATIKRIKNIDTNRISQ